MIARILIIEDNLANLELAKYLLEAGGYTVLTAMNGVEGLQLAQQERPDMVVSDLQMPLMDGYELLQNLRNDPNLQRIPVIAVTAFSMPGDQHKVLLTGFDGYISKPIVPEAFLQQVEAFLPVELRVGRPSEAS
jgi:two-component system cell cycle response regulator DivK